jgi:hypothetical protein
VVELWPEWEALVIGATETLSVAAVFVGATVAPGESVAALTLVLKDASADFVLACRAWRMAVAAVRHGWSSFRDEGNNRVSENS